MDARFAAVCAGWTLVALAKVVEKPVVRDVGYGLLLASLKFNHRYDALAALGYVLALFGAYGVATPLLISYLVLDLTIDQTFFIGRVMIIAALSLGYRNPLTT